jgi:hypothetical protein
MPKQSNARIDPKELDSRGRVAVFLNAQKRWSWRHPIDAREIVGTGAGSFDAPEGAPPKPSPQSPMGDRLEQIDRRAEEARMDDELDAVSAGSGAAASIGSNVSQADSPAERLTRARGGNRGGSGGG